MHFLAPKILFWLFALPIPFIIHLWHRKTIRRVWFSSILLLKRAEQGEQSFKRLKDILLLILRTLVLLFLVLAFANPVLHKRQKVVMLDDSYEMLAKITSQPSPDIFDLALKETRKFRGAKIILASGDKYKHGSAPKYQRFILDTKNADYIITKSGKLPVEKGARIIEIEGREDNFSIDSIDFKDTKLFAKITNHTNKPAEKLVALYTNPPQAETLSARVSVPAKSSIITLFPLPEKSISAGKSGCLEIDSDALDIDNIKYFVIPKIPPLNALVIGDVNNTFFIKNALAPPGADSKITVSNIGRDLIYQVRQSHSGNYDAFISNNEEALRFPNTIFAPVETPAYRTGRDDHQSLPNNGFLTITNLLETHPIFAEPTIVNELKQMKFTKVVKPDAKLLNNNKILARFSDGSPAIIELENKNLWFAFPLNQASPDLVVSPIFVPFMHQVVYWVAGKPLQKYNFFSGEQIKIKAQKPGNYNCRNISAKDVKTDIYKLSAAIESEGIYLNVPVEKPGLYQIEGIPGAKDTTVFAVNINNELVLSSVEGFILSSGMKQAFPFSTNNVPIRNFLLWFVLVLLGLELVLRRR